MKSPERGDVVWIDFDPQAGLESALPPGLPVQGVVLSDHVRSLDWRTRRAEFICRAPSEVMDDVTAKVAALLGNECSVTALAVLLNAKQRRHA